MQKLNYTIIELTRPDKLEKGQVWRHPDGRHLYKILDIIPAPPHIRPMYDSVLMQTYYVNPNGYIEKFPPHISDGHSWRCQAIYNQIFDHVKIQINGFKKLCDANKE